MELEILDIKGNFVGQALGLVDSGADRTAVNMSYLPAIGLGLSLASMNEVAGVGSQKIPALATYFRFKIKGTKHELVVPANFVDSEHVDVVLGQEVFFDLYKIIFEKSKSTFEIVRVNK
ncbi:MAG: hypothetical protein RL641_494 [Candidatus Parcubacteria bacterium]